MTEFEVKIASEYDNKLLERKEYIVEIRHPGQSTPSRYAVRERFASMLGVPIDLVIVRSLSTRYGTNLTIGRIHVYKNPDAVKIEPEHIIKRNAPKKEGE